MAPQLKLPPSIATKNDLSMVINNLTDVLNVYIENNVRQDEGVEFQSRANVSSRLAELVRLNNLSISLESLKGLKAWLDQLQSTAPVVRFTFAADPTPEFLGALATWLRNNSGRFVLIRFGVQPSIAAGCLMYTPARRYDFSLRRKLLASGPVFAKVMRELTDQAAQKRPVT